MKILTIGKCRLMNEVLTESLICRDFEAKTSEDIHTLFSVCTEVPVIVFYIDNELFLSFAELNKVFHKIKEEHQLKFIAICSKKELAYDCIEMKFGFDAMLLLASGLNDVFFAISEVVRGQRYYVPELKYLQESTISSTQAFIHPSVLIKNLTKREKEILVQIAQSKTTTTIAQKLYISNATVNNHKANIMVKLQITGRNSLITTAIALKPWLETAA